MAMLGLLKNASNTKWTLIETITVCKTITQRKKGLYVVLLLLINTAYKICCLYSARAVWYTNSTIVLKST